MLRSPFKYFDQFMQFNLYYLFEGIKRAFSCLSLCCSTGLSRRLIWYLENN